MEDNGDYVAVIFVFREGKAGTILPTPATEADRPRVPNRTIRDPDERAAMEACGKAFDDLVKSLEKLLDKALPGMDVDFNETTWGYHGGNRVFYADFGVAPK